MQYISRAEVDGEVGDFLRTIRDISETAFLPILADYSVWELDCKIRYVPIIMRPDWAARYPARSRLERKKRIYNCCPQLEFEPFQLKKQQVAATVYIEGLRECGPALIKLGATAEQAGEFELALDAALEAVRMQAP